jgi:hypothetical protein
LRHTSINPFNLEPPRELQEWIVSQLERDDRVHAGLPDGIAPPHELRGVQTGRLFEQDVFAASAAATA